MWKFRSFARLPALVRSQRVPHVQWAAAKPLRPAQELQHGRANASFAGNRFWQQHKVRGRVPIQGSAGSENPLNHVTTVGGVADDDGFVAGGGGFAAADAVQPTFVSSHFRLDPADVIAYLKRKNFTLKEAGDKVVLRDCPLCHPTHNKPDNMWKMYVWTHTGSYFCHRCGKKGSWFDLKKHLGDIADPEAAGASDTAAAAAPASSADAAQGHERKSVAAPDQELMLSYRDNLRTEEFKDVLRYLTTVDGRYDDATRTWSFKGRGLRQEVLEKYGVGALTAKFQEDDSTFTPYKCVSFPWTRLDPSARGANYYVDRVKLRAVREKRFQRILPVGGAWGFFGWHTIPIGTDSVVITEGEYDAMAVYQATGMPAISLPNGARSLPVELLPCLEPFKKIYLWMDDDVAGQEGAEKFARKLGLQRCYLVRSRALSSFLPQSRDSVLSTEDKAKPTAKEERWLRSLSKPPKDANEALQIAMNQAPEHQQLLLKAMHQMILEAEPLRHKQITTFTSLRQEIFREFSQPSAVRGLQSRSLPSLNRILKGFRRGELTVLTGPTGVGKTTILSQLSLDYCEQGANTLWGSFEIKNARLAKKMLLQFAGQSLESNLNSFDMWADRFQQLPLYFLRFFGSTDVEQVIDAMDYAVYVHDVEHIVLDNLQFMLSGQSKSGIDKFEVQDRAIERFRQFATNRNVHITLVIHPRKETDRTALGLSSVFGTAKATQEADNVLIVQDGPKFRTLEIKKNRFDGEVGSIPMRFDRVSHSLKEISQAEMLRLEAAGDNVHADTFFNLPGTSSLSAATVGVQAVPVAKPKSTGFVDGARRGRPRAAPVAGDATPNQPQQQANIVSQHQAVATSSTNATSVQTTGMAAAAASGVTLSAYGGATSNPNYPSAEDGFDQSMAADEEALQDAEPLLAHDIWSTH